MSHFAMSHFDHAVDYICTKIGNYRLRKALKDKSDWRTITRFRGCKFWTGSDNKIEVALVEQHCYDYTNMTAVSHLVKPGDICLDVGGNIGVYSMVMAQLSGDDDNIHAFEPVNHIRARLEANAKLNGFHDLHVNPFALGAKPDKIEMFQVKKGQFRGGTSTFMNNENVQAMGQDKFDKLAVDIVPMDTYVAQNDLPDVNFIKIDVEGFEWPVLEGGKGTIAKFRPYILLEFDLIRHGQWQTEFRDYFRELDYTVYEFTIKSGAPVMTTYDFSKTPVNRNILCIPN